MRKRSAVADGAAAHADELFRSRLENQIDRKLPRQADTSEVEILALRYSAGVMPPRPLWGRCSL